MEEIIVENVQLKEDIDRMTDELMEAVDDQSEIRQKYEQMELRLSTVRDILLKDISNTRNPRVSYVGYIDEILELLSNLLL